MLYFFDIIRGKYFDAFVFFFLLLFIYLFVIYIDDIILKNNTEIIYILKYFYNKLF